MHSSASSMHNHAMGADAKHSAEPGLNTHQAAPSSKVVQQQQPHQTASKIEEEQHKSYFPKHYSDEDAHLDPLRLPTHHHDEKGDANHATVSNTHSSLRRSFDHQTPAYEHAAASFASDAVSKDRYIHERSQFFDDGDDDR
jgi:hypothetical protein